MPVPCVSVKTDARLPLRFGALSQTGLSPTHLHLLSFSLRGDFLQFHSTSRSLQILHISPCTRNGKTPPNFPSYFLHVSFKPNIPQLSSERKKKYLCNLLRYFCLHTTLDFQTFEPNCNGKVRLKVPTFLPKLPVFYTSYRKALTFALNPESLTLFLQIFSNFPSNKNASFSQPPVFSQRPFPLSDTLHFFADGASHSHGD